MSATPLTHYGNLPTYRTKDGSEIRELMHPIQHGSRRQSLAEATVPVGGATLLHRHHQSEELYHVTAGQARMTLGDAEFPLAPGDTVCIPPDTPHRLVNTGTIPLRVLCCCSPAYAHEDTELLE